MKNVYRGRPALKVYSMREMIRTEDEGVRLGAGLQEDIIIFAGYQCVLASVCNLT